MKNEEPQRIKQERHATEGRRLTRTATAGGRIRPRVLVGAGTRPGGSGAKIPEAPASSRSVWRFSSRTPSRARSP